MPDDDDMSQEAQCAETVANSLERDDTCTRIGWNDLGEVTVGSTAEPFGLPSPTLRTKTDLLALPARVVGSTGSSADKETEAND